MFDWLLFIKMKAFNNSVSSRTSPDFRNANVYLVKSLNGGQIRQSEYGMLDKVVSKQLKKKKKKNTKIYI